MVLVKLIQEVNHSLSTSGSSEEIVVIGPSMGGQIARYALAYMEKQESLAVANMDHNTRLYVSFDSPHLGANIPLSLQQAIYTIGYGLNREQAQKSYNDQLRSKAARQMLIEQMDGHNSTAAFHTQYYNNHLINNGLSGSDGWPLNLRKVSLINGAANGQKNGTEGLKFFSVHAGGFIKILHVEASSMPMYGNVVSPFYGVGGISGILPRSFSDDMYNNNSRGSMDVMPGGTFNTGLILRDQIKETVDKIGLGIGTFTNILKKIILL